MAAMAEHFLSDLSGYLLSAALSLSAWSSKETMCNWVHHVYQTYSFIQKNGSLRFNPDVTMVSWYAEHYCVTAEDCKSSH